MRAVRCWCGLVAECQHRRQRRNACLLPTPHRIWPSGSSLRTAPWRANASSLQGAEFHYETRLFPERAYTFKHALTQQVAYQSLLTSTRQRYHAQLAQALAAYPETVETPPELLAHHATEAGLAEQAMGYWQRAGECSIGRSAYVEAVAQLTRGLEVLHTLPDTPARARHELEMQLVLNRALLATKGVGAPERGHTLARARELCLQVGDTPQLCTVLGGLAGFHLKRGEFQMARELAEQHLSLAQDLQDLALRMTAHTTMGVLLYYLGELTAAQAHLEQAIGLRAFHPDRSLTLRFGPNNTVVCLANTAWILWMQGYPEQALRRSQEMRTYAQTLSHAFRAEVYRIKGEILLQQAIPDAPQAAACFQQALTVARRQQARSWELRAAMSLSRLWQQQGKRTEARELVAPIYR